MADDETLAHDGQAFDCETCVVRQALDGLDADNAAAWGLFRRLCTRFVVDRRLTPMLLARETAGLDDEDTADLVTRLSILYEAFYPVRPAHGA